MPRKTSRSTRAGATRPKVPVVRYTGATTPTPTPRAPLPPRPPYTPPPDPPTVRLTGATTAPPPTTTPEDSRYTYDPARLLSQYEPTTAPAATQTLDKRLYTTSRFETHEDFRLTQYDRTTTVSEQQTSIFGEPIDLEGPIGLSFADQPLGTTPRFDTGTYAHEDFRLSQYDRTVPAVPNLIDYSRLTPGQPSQYTGPEYPPVGSEQAYLGPVAQAEEYFLGTGARWGLGSSYIGIAPEDRKPPPILSLSTVRILTSGTSVTMDDLKRIYEYNSETGHYLLKEDVPGDDDYTGDDYYTGDDRSATASYQRATTGTGYTGRYSGASTGLINWRIGF